MAHALRGLRLFLAQPNARIEAAIGLLTVSLGAYLGISAAQWLAVLLAMALVLCCEALNTALELAVDLASPQWQALARDAKDVAAAAVLMACIAAAIVGLLVFAPYVLKA